MEFCSIKRLKEGAVTFLGKEKYLMTLLANIERQGIRQLTILTTEKLANDIFAFKPELCNKKRLQLEIKENPKQAFFDLIRSNTDYYKVFIVGRPEFPYSIIYDNVKIGKYVFIEPGAVIGGYGFGYEKDDTGMPQRLPHIGGVIIEDNVHIKANSCVDRGTIDDTIIGYGSKLDHFVHVAHNVIIGQNCQLICHCGIGGSAEIGDNVWVGMGAQIRNGVKVGSNAVIGMGAIVVKDVPEGVTVVGNPAKELVK